MDGRQKSIILPMNTTPRCIRVLWTRGSGLVAEQFIMFAGQVTRKMRAFSPSKITVSELREYEAGLKRYTSSTRSLTTEKETRGYNRTCFERAWYRSIGKG